MIYIKRDLLETQDDVVQEWEHLKNVIKKQWQEEKHRKRRGLRFWAPDLTKTTKDKQQANGKTIQRTTQRAIQRYIKTYILTQKVL